MKKKHVICLVLALCVVLPVLAMGILADSAAYTPKAIPSDYFYGQLNDRAKAIYDKLLTEFTGANKARYYTGTESVDLMGLTYGTGNRQSIDTAAVEEYRKGNKALFNDFCAAKDALDLDHSELWYIDSGYLTFRVTQDYRGYHVLVGPGRGPTYLLAGETMTSADVLDMDRKVNDVIDGIVRRAAEGLNGTVGVGSYTDSDKLASLVTRVHDEVIRSIHYRYEIECTYPQDAKYIRTLYGIVTHEGVCEAYARTMQVCLTRLGIECVLVHGLQTKGTPEDHMWNAVNIPDTVNGRRVDRWYVVDATWDDPLTADYTGKRDLTFNYGLDGKETNTYLLVGQTLVGQNWRPSGYVSTGNFEFKYPTIETAAYSGAVVQGDDNGLKVSYSAGGSMEDSTPAGVFTVTYQGMNAAKAREKGLYFMVRMYDYHSDGTAHVMDEWYYADATFILSEGNPYFGDYGEGLRISTSTCEYVEIAVTTREPDHRSSWSSDPNTSYLSKNPEAGYFHGDDSEIIAQSGMLYNVNSTYEAPPYVLTQTPAPNGNATAGVQYRFKVTWDDDLYHILPSGSAYLHSGEGYAEASLQRVQIRYTTIQQDLHTGGDKTVQIAGELPFDRDKDGVVDMDGSYTDFTWLYTYDGRYDQCPNHARHVNGKCDVERGCPIMGVEFNFRASDLWIDDVTEYNFSVEGVVGSRSGKFPNNFSVICVVPGLCPACYRSQGIDWNLWGQPTLLDAPENLDLHAMAVSGGTDAETLKKLDEEMRRDDMNGRLMLVVEDKSRGAGSRTEYEKINGALEESGELRGRDVAFSSIFEINFNRVCPMVKLKPNRGESLRVQVGYPAGVTYESLGEGKYDLKAYHFTRCAENEPCDEYKAELAAAKTEEERANVKRTHDWGGHIISVEEIQIIPTPYGMVIMCDAFSPFEIVAFENPNPRPVTETTHTVVVVTDMNGTVSVNGEEAVGEAGNVRIADGGSKTFTVNANPGYVIDTVSFGGQKLTVSANAKSFTLSNVKKSDVLSVTFVAQSVHTAEVNRGQSAVASGVCSHPSTHKVSSGTHAGDTAPTCTTPGYVRDEVCSICGQVVTPGHEIPATGHTDLTVIGAEVAPTCTQPGATAAVRCNTCGEIVHTAAPIQALGHSFTNHTLTGAVTCQGAEITARCDRCGVTETVFDPSRAVPHSYTVSGGITTPATCSHDATELLKCQWCGTAKAVAKPGTATGHLWGADNYCTKCGKNRCVEEGHSLVDIPAVKGSCTTNGTTAGRKCSVCGYVTSYPEIIPAPGHQYDEEGTCTVCGHKRIHSYSQHISEILPAQAATCVRSGLTEGTRCTICGDITNPQRVVPMTEHRWDTDEGDVVWHWCTTDGVSAVAELHCLSGDHILTVEAGMSYQAIKGHEPSCAETGFGSYMAMVTLDDSHSASTTKDNVIIPATGHKVAQYTYNSDHNCQSAGTMTGICSVCGASITVDAGQKGDHVWHYAVVEPTCFSGGYTAARCSVCGTTQVTNRTAKLAHSYVNGKCSLCGVAQGSTYKSGLTQAHPVILPVSAFKDVPSGIWYAEDLRYVSTRGIILGDEKGNFNPDNLVTRVQFLTLLARFDFNAASTGADWFNASLNWARALNISDGSNPNTAIDREELVTLLWRYCGSPKVSFDLGVFADVAKVNSWSADAFRWAVSTGIISGVSATDLGPQEMATRAQAAAIFARFARLIEG